MLGERVGGERSGTDNTNPEFPEMSLSPGSMDVSKNRDIELEGRDLTSSEADNNGVFMAPTPRSTVLLENPLAEHEDQDQDQDQEVELEEGVVSDWAVDVHHASGLVPGTILSNAVCSPVMSPPSRSRVVSELQPGDL